MQQPPQTGAVRTPVAAWVLYVLCLLAVGVVVLLTGFLTSQGAAGCSLGGGPHPSSCTAGTAGDLVGVYPLAVGGAYAVVTPVLIVLLRRRSAPTLVPLTAAFVAATAMVVFVALR